MNLRTELQSVETDTILNTIDGLRSLGIGSILDLPQIIVCGDQSSGKSSVLNAVSSIRFPTKDGLCTRFATEVIMRPGSPESIVVSIVPSSNRSTDEKRTLAGFRHSNVNMDEIEALIGQAATVMGIDPDDPRAKRFSDDILRFEVTGPHQPSLTLVDLPGLFLAPSKYQTDEDTNSVRKLVLQYMRNKRSVILAVISAKSEFVLQAVTKYSREVDPRGLRTLGVITKPDKLDAGSESEKEFIELANNRLAFLHRGWHVLVNRDHNTKNSTQDQRDDFENHFLSSGAWSGLTANHKGVFSLRSRLSGLLRDQILEELPDLIQEADSEIAKCKASLSQLGVSRATPEDRRRYLIQAAQTFNVIMRSCVNGSYDDKFFNSGNPSVDSKKRLRAVVQNTLMDYSDDMHKIGHAKHIVDAESTKGESPHPQQVTQKEFEDEVMELMKHSRGRELMGTYNPIFVRELFLTQSEPWVDVTREYQSKIWEAARASIDLVLHYATDKVTKMQLKQMILEPSLDRLRLSLDKMTNKLLTPRHESHPITYNRRLVEDVQRVKRAFALKIFEENYSQAVNTRGEVVAKETLAWLFAQDLAIPTANLPRFAASEAIDIMRAYYKIAKETLVDNFSSLAIEDCLVSQMPDLLSPEIITALDDDTISIIAMETDSAALERSETEDKLEMCQSGLLKLRKIEGMRAPGIWISDVPPLDTATKFETLEDMDGSERDIGTEVSQLDLGLSDQEDRPMATSESVPEVEDTSITRKKKKKTVARDPWVAV